MKTGLSGPVLAGMAFLRRHLSRIKIRREARAFSSPARMELGATPTLEILPLYEAAAADGLQAGMGVSYLIRTGSSVLLFDLGNNPDASTPSPLEQNMARLGVSMDEVGMIVLSHRHPDHAGGMKWWKARTFSVTGASQPPLSPLPVFVSEKIAYPGTRLTLARKPLLLAEGVATTGPFTFFEPFHVPWIMPRDNEQALAVNVAGRGIVLITGCGHMGLRALLERSDALWSVPVIGVVGGLHYTKAGPEVFGPDIRLLQKRSPAIVALSPHDSGAAALKAFAAAFPGVCRTLRAGEAIQIS
jgi:metal-dependent hydrolase (beta-lactamase superfamily II)